jgi:uncharacterized membrane-anchored protein
MFNWKGLTAAITLACLPLTAAAQAPETPPAAQAQRPPPLTGLVKRTGQIALPAAKAKLTMSKDYYFLDASDAKRVLVDAWGNPPSAVEDVLGMIFPTRFEPDGKGAWGAVVTFRDIGFVEDKDARSTDYDKVLADLRATENEENAQAKKEGYPGVHLAGWAEAPSYDASNHVVIWARDLIFEGEENHTLNYDIRVLGRHGVLSLNAVGALSDLSEIRNAAASVRQTAGFETGARYTDVDKAKDKMAGIGIAGLIAGGAGLAVAKKAGLLAIILAFGKKFIVLIVIAFGAIANWFRTRLGRKPAPAAAVVEDVSEPPPAPEADAKHPEDDTVT